MANDGRRLRSDREATHRVASLLAAMCGTIVAIGVFLPWARPAPEQGMGSSVTWDGTRYGYHGTLVLLLALIGVATSASLNAAGHQRARIRPGRSVVSFMCFGFAAVVVAIDLGWQGIYFARRYGETLEPYFGIHVTLFAAIVATCCAAVAAMQVRWGGTPVAHRAITRLAALFASILLVSVVLPWATYSPRSPADSSPPRTWTYDGLQDAGLFIFPLALVAATTSMAMGAGRARPWRAKLACTIVPCVCLALSAGLMLVPFDVPDVEPAFGRTVATVSAIAGTLCAVITLIRSRLTTTPAAGVSP